VSSTLSPESLQDPVSLRLLRWLLVPLSWLYTLYAWVAFLLIGGALLIVMLIVPARTLRRRIVRVVARAALWLIGMPLSVTGLDQVPLPSITVANHVSYLDGVVLQAVLPPHFGFVIKREMASVPLLGLLLRRIGSQFVERNHPGGSTRDALRVVRSAASGEALGFFPEGTFGPRPGLARFHIGAFAAAVRAGLPIVPIVIQGTRSCLPPGTIRPRPGRIRVQILPPLQPQADAADAAGMLRDAARASILRHLGEPDLIDGQ
jgi:1-acyl-sn-glycerol-3-phosphate acyltransferase